MTRKVSKCCLCSYFMGKTSQPWARRLGLLSCLPSHYSHVHHVHAGDQGSHAPAPLNSSTLQLSHDLHFWTCGNLSLPLQWTSICLLCSQRLTSLARYLPTSPHKIPTPVLRHRVPGHPNPIWQMRTSPLISSCLPSESRETPNSPKDAKLERAELTGNLFRVQAPSPCTVL